MEQEQFNHTTPHVAPLDPKRGLAGFYALVCLALLVLIGGAAAAVVYIRRKARLDELRHRLIPLYSYDPAEEEEEAWSDGGGGGGGEAEERQLTEPLYKEGKLSFSPFRA